MPWRQSRSLGRLEAEVSREPVERPGVPEAGTKDGTSGGGQRPAVGRAPEDSDEAYQFFGAKVKGNRGIRVSGSMCRGLRADEYLLFGDGILIDIYFLHRV